MKVNRLHLIQDMNKVLPGIATGTVTIENSDTVVFNNGHIYSYNSSISVDVAESTPSGLKGVVKGIDFYNCISKLVSEEIEVDATEREWIIKDGKIKVSITLIEADNMFERFKAVVPNETWIDIDGADFNKALTICNMSKNTSKFAGIYVNGNEFISTDAYVINKYVAKNEYPSFFISNESVAQLIKWDDFKAVEINKKWVQFKSANGTIFSVRSLATDTFPYDKISGAIDGYLALDSILESSFTPEFYNAVERAATLSKENGNHEVVDISISSTGCKIKSERVSGAYEEEIQDIKSDGAEFNLELDINMIRSCKAHFDTFKLADKQTDKGIIKTIILSKDSSIKIFSAIC